MWSGLCAREYAGNRTVWHRVPVLVEFGEFARAFAVRIRWRTYPFTWMRFVAQWAAKANTRRHPRGDHERGGQGGAWPDRAGLLELVVADFRRPRSTASDGLRFTDAMPGFLRVLGRRGVVFGQCRLMPTGNHLARFEDYLDAAIGLKELTELSPTVLARVSSPKRRAGWAGQDHGFGRPWRDAAGVVPAFMGTREGCAPPGSERDSGLAAGSIGSPMSRGRSRGPRLERVLAGVDRRTPCGKKGLRDLAAAYQLRSARPLRSRH